jgi:hypothetical protein
MSIHDETFDYDKAIKFIQTPKADKELKTLVKRLFEILDQKEESDSGREFSPVFISCCRVTLGEELKQILPKMKELSND